MTCEAFGAGPVTVAACRGTVLGSVDVRSVRAAVDAQRVGDPPLATFSRCAPTAAFSRRDTFLPGYDAAVEVAHAHGFEPVIRPVGGRLAAYDEGSLVLHLRSGHPDARAHIDDRFVAFGALLVDVLTTLGMEDLRIGPVPGEYCAGEWSVNQAGRRKVAGTGQRLNRHGYLFSAVITVARAHPVRAFLTEAYDALALDFTPESVGAVADAVKGIGIRDVQAALGRGLVGLFHPVASATGP